MAGPYQGHLHTHPDGQKRIDIFTSAQPVSMIPILTRT